MSATRFLATAAWDIDRGHQNLFDAVLIHDLGLAHLAGADSHRAGIDLHLGDRRTLVRFRMGPARNSVRAHRRLHLRQVRFKQIEINAKRRRVEFPFRDIDLHLPVNEETLHFGGGVTAHRRGKPDCGRPAGLQKNGAG